MNGEAVRSNWRNRDSVELSVRQSWGEESDTACCRTQKHRFFFFLSCTFSHCSIFFSKHKSLSEPVLPKNATIWLMLQSSSWPSGKFIGKSVTEFCALHDKTSLVMKVHCRRLLTQRMHLSYWFWSVLIFPALLRGSLLFLVHTAIPANQLKTTKTHFDNIYLRKRPQWPRISLTSTSQSPGVFAVSSTHPAPHPPSLLQRRWRFQRPLVVIGSGWATEQTAQRSPKAPICGLEALWPGWEEQEEVAAQRPRPNMSVEEN